MIKFEHNMLVLNNAFSQEDVEEINAYAEYVRKQERERIIALIEGIGLGCLECSDWQLMNVIKLIKEENK